VGAGVGTGVFLVAILRVVARAARRARWRDAAFESVAMAPDHWQALLAPRLPELQAVLVAVLASVRWMSLASPGHEPANRPGEGHLHFVDRLPQILRAVSVIAYCQQEGRRASLAGHRGSPLGQ
jgi:hypothetical protein